MIKARQILSASGIPQLVAPSKLRPRYFSGVNHLHCGECKPSKYAIHFPYRLEVISFCKHCGGWMSWYGESGWLEDGNAVIYPAPKYRTPTMLAPLVRAEWLRNEYGLSGDRTNAFSKVEIKNVEWND